MNQIEDRALQPIRECVDAGGIAEIDVIVHDVRLVLTDSPAGLDDPPAVLRRLFDKASSDPLRTANDQRHFDGIALSHSDSPSIKSPDRLKPPDPAASPQTHYFERCAMICGGVHRLSDCVVESVSCDLDLNSADGPRYILLP
jgi:hypothetical protein